MTSEHESCSPGMEVGRLSECALWPDYCCCSLSSRLRERRVYSIEGEGKEKGVLPQIEEGGGVKTGRRRLQHLGPGGKGSNCTRKTMPNFERNRKSVPRLFCQRQNAKKPLMLSRCCQANI